MANFLRRWLSRPEPAPEVREAVAMLEQLARARPALQAPAGVLVQALPELFAEAADVSAPSLLQPEAHVRLAAGVPLLRDVSLSLAHTPWQRRWHALCAALAQHADSDAVVALDAAVRRGTLEPSKLLAAVLAGDSGAIDAAATPLGLDPSLTATTLRLTSLPCLSRVSAALAPLREGVAWHQGYCPLCGSWPLLGEFRGLDQLRVLRCGLCASAWDFPRLRCPFCDEHDHRHLGYLHVEGAAEQQRAATCASCRGYVKMTATLAPLSPPMLLAVDVATLHLDFAARERGYRLP